MQPESQQTDHSQSLLSPSTLQTGMKGVETMKRRKNHEKKNVPLERKSLQLEKLKKLIEKIRAKELLIRKQEQKLKKLKRDFTKKKYKKYFKNLKGHVSIERELFVSDAFRDLTGGAAIRILLMFHYKTWKKFKKGRKQGGSKSLIITNNGEITLTYRELQYITGHTRHTIAKCLKELIDEKGFIDVDERGTGRGTDRKATKYSISYRWMDYDTDRYRKPKKGFKIEP